MEGLTALAVAVVLVLLGFGVALLLGRRGRQRAAPAAVAAVLLSEPPQLAWLGAAQRQRWQRQVDRFLREKRFIGCAGLVVTPLQQHTIAGMACLLRVQQDAEQQPLFPTVREVLLYPDAFLVPPSRGGVSEEGLEIVDDGPGERIGEHGPGQVVLSWADVERAQAENDLPVVIHEFAHALDSENPETEGAPPMADYSAWSAVMAAEFARLKRHRRPPVLDPYGAESPAEFWCVVAEAFFQQPQALASHHPALYRLLSGYFEIDPLLNAADLAAASGAA